ncbi:VOC family protein [Streptomyces nigra]|uniref:VOC family protein n=1 Tax=Streptomyces nigra TaxID=1827580 RepID=UPI00368C9671
MRKEEPGWVKIAAPDGSAALSFQTEPLFTRPRWPSTRSEQQMMMHLDIEVNDLSSAVEHARALGGTVATSSPRLTCAPCTTQRATRSASSNAPTRAPDRSRQ